MIFWTAHWYHRNVAMCKYQSSDKCSRSLCLSWSYWRRLTGETKRWDRANNSKFSRLTAAVRATKSPPFFLKQKFSANKGTKLVLFIYTEQSNSILMMSLWVIARWYSVMKRGGRSESCVLVLKFKCVASNTFKARITVIICPYFRCLVTDASCF